MPTDAQGTEQSSPKLVRPRRKITTVAWALLEILGLVVLVFVAFGLRESSSENAPIPYRLTSALLQVGLLVFATVGVLDTIRGSALRGIRGLGKTGGAVPVEHAAFRPTSDSRIC